MSHNRSFISYSVAAFHAKIRSFDFAAPRDRFVTRTRTFRALGNLRLKFVNHDFDPIRDAIIDAIFFRRTGGIRRKGTDKICAFAPLTN